MSFEAGLAVAMSLIVASLIADWPRAVAGLVVGCFGPFMPYTTIVLPLVILCIAGLGEIVYPMLGRTAEPTLQSFWIGVFSAGLSACSIYVTMRNLKDRF